MQSDCLVAEVDAGLRVGGKCRRQRLSEPRLELTHGLEAGAELRVQGWPRDGSGFRQRSPGFVAARIQVSVARRSDLRNTDVRVSVLEVGQASLWHFFS